MAGCVVACDLLGFCLLLVVGLFIYLFIIIIINFFSVCMHKSQWLAVIVDFGCCHGGGCEWVLGLD